MLTLFRIVGLFESMSFVALICIAMPLKYAANLPQAVSAVGMFHGVVFMAYICTAIYLAYKSDWPRRQLFFSFVAAIIPLGTFAFDRKYFGKGNKGLSVQSKGQAQNWNNSYK